MNNKKFLPATIASTLLTFSLNLSAMVNDQSINNNPAEQVRNAKIADKLLLKMAQ
jgi:hypothetical protein